MTQISGSRDHKYQRGSHKGREKPSDGIPGSRKLMNRGCIAMLFYHFPPHNCSLSQILEQDKENDPRYEM